jgi:hypothetical protein
MKRIFATLGILMLLVGAGFAQAGVGGSCSAPGTWILNSAPGEGNQASVTHTPNSTCTSFIDYVCAQLINASSGPITTALEVTGGSATNWFYMGTNAYTTENLTIPFAPQGIGANSELGWMPGGLGGTITIKFYGAVTSAYESITVIGFDD